ncbi:MAG: hypothetical protein LBH80_07360 [Prevotellaceae bacterium]|nr:hypothetical protein [Prevotellaceae bacterium]
MKLIHLSGVLYTSEADKLQGLVVSQAFRFGAKKQPCATPDRRLRKGGNGGG